MRVVYKEPGLRAQVLDIRNDLPTLQAMVGGYIEAVHESLPTKGGTIPYVVILNEEGRWMGMPANIECAHGPAYVGPVLAVGEAGEFLAGLMPGEARAIAEHFDARAVITGEGD